MKQILLAVLLIALPVGLFAGAFAYLSGGGAGLGDMSAFEAIVNDVSVKAEAGDLPGAAARITDLETAWDDAQPTLRPKDAQAWGAVDGAIDAALNALRSETPEAEPVKAALANLALVMADPVKAETGGAGGVVLVGGIPVTGQDGRPLPCEVMLTDLRQGLAAAKLSAADQAKAEDLQAKALERCNADDDAHADDFSARALAVVKGN